MTPDADPWLVADLGGTNVRFALADPGSPGVLREDSIRAYKVDAFDTLAEAAHAYGETAGGLPSQAVLAAAGPVTDDGVQLTNHPWQLNRQALQTELRLKRLALVNDFAALAACVPLLAPAQLRALPGPALTDASAAPRMHLVLGPGTGLGVAGLRLENGRSLVLQTEAGHAGMAPTDELEIDLLQRLSRRFGRVSHERLLCGPGLQNLHAALCERASLAPLASAPTPESIVRHALDGSDPLCALAVERFCLLLAGVAGDLALSLGAWDGVYFAGSLLQSLQPWLDAPAFRQRFEAKGRLRATVERVPLVQILHPEAGLLGAAAWARERARAA
jgi:glucokinase